MSGVGRGEAGEGEGHGGDPDVAGSEARHARCASFRTKDRSAQLLDHSTVTATMRHAHTCRNSKRAAVEKLVAFGDSLMTVAPKRSKKTLVRNTLPTRRIR
jgi:hypothetical protein